MKLIEPIETSHLFPVLDGLLIQLLRNLTSEDWGKAAIHKWTVKDVAAHLLDSNVRRLSMGRDGHWGESFDPRTGDIAEFINRLNRDWVGACKRISPALLIDLIESTGKQMSAYVASLDPNGPATFAVSWAGESSSLHWFDVAREYTEKWHHQQQIREAVGKPGIMSRELYAPVIETFMLAMPFCYRDTPAQPGTEIEFIVTGDAGGNWTLERTDDGWELRADESKRASAEVEIPGDIAWKLFTKGLPPEAAARSIRIKGDQNLASSALSAIAIVG